MNWTKRIKGNWIWGLLSAIVWREWSHPHEAAVMLEFAASFALFGSVFDVVNERVPWPKWGKRKGGPTE